MSAVENLMASAPTPEQEAAAAAAEARLAQLLKMGDITQANAATGIVGDSGTGKSTLAATGVRYCWERYHKISRYIAADPGGFGNMLLRQIRLGIAQVYNPTNHIEPFETMENLSLGWWPEKIDDPYTGYAQPDVRLIPPQQTHYAVHCQHDHVVRTVASKAALNGFSMKCPGCGTVVTPQNWQRVEEVVVRSPWIKHVGLYVFDSGTSLSDWAMEDMANRAAMNDPALKDGNALSQTGARILSGQYAFGANTVVHYGFAQLRVRAWIKNSRKIPGQVVPPIWTFLEQRATDDNRNVPVFGPKIAGQAMTAIVPSWLGNCLNTTKEQNQKGKVKHRVWLVNHTDPGSTIPHLAKTRAEPGDLPPYLEDTDEKGDDLPAFTRVSLGYFFDQLEIALDRNTRLDAEAYPDAPAFHPIEAGEAEIVSSRDLSAGQLGVRVATPPPQPSAPAQKAATIAAAQPGSQSGTGRPSVSPTAARPAATSHTPVSSPVAAATTTTTPTPTPTSTPVPTPTPQAAAPPVQTAGPPPAPPPPVRPPTPAAVRPIIRAAVPPPPGAPKRK